MPEIQNISALENDEKRIRVSVKAGDTIYSILRKQGITPTPAQANDIIKINNLNKTGDLTVGQVLKLTAIAAPSSLEIETKTTLSLDSVRAREKLDLAILMESIVPKKSKELFPNQPKTGWDNWEEKQINSFHMNAKCPKEQIRNYEGLEFMLDGGTLFVKVPKGFGRIKLIEKISKIKPYGRDLSYLNPHSNQLTSLNISSDELRENQWVPLPMKPEERKLSDKQFMNYCHQAIAEILTLENERDKSYKNELQEILKLVPEKELLSTMIAIAKQESGNQIGMFSFHKWETNKKAFSLSMFHVLIDSKNGRDTAGLIAAKKLGMTPGQMMHPKNAAKLFIGFICEKYRSANPNCSNERIAKYVAGFIGNPEKIATEHNGTNWKTKNPSYADSIKRNLKQAKALF